MNMACTLFRLTPVEALAGATVYAARALGLRDVGTLEVGQRADFVLWASSGPRIWRMRSDSILPRRSLSRRVDSTLCPRRMTIVREIDTPRLRLRQWRDADRSRLRR